MDPAGSVTFTDDTVNIVTTGDLQEKDRSCCTTSGKRTKSILLGTGLLLLVLASAVGIYFGVRPSNDTSYATPHSTLPTSSPPSTPFSWKSAFGTYRYGAVATDTKLCSTIGTEILARRGGSAVDAAIAAMLCVGVVNAHSTGIGGGHFMTIYDRPRDSDEKVVKTINAREMAPAAAHKDMYVNHTQDSRYGGLAVGVPGEVAGYYQAWKMFGRLKWGQILEPTIQLCMNGFKVESSLASALAQRKNMIKDNPVLSSMFIKEDGTVYKEGDVMRRRRLGVTLQKIAADPFTMYNGTLADDIVNDLNETGGIITVADMNNYRAQVKDPINITIHNGNYTVFFPRPPSSGVIFGYILSVLDGYAFSKRHIEVPNKVLTYHRIIEAFKFAYARRTNLADEEYVNLEPLIANLTSKSYAEATRQKINDTKTQPLEYYEPTYDVDIDHGTAHLSVLAPDGSAVAITSTINLWFGAFVGGNRTGILFNDEMDDFSTPGTSNAFGFPASPANFIRPGKRPLSSMCPTIIVDGNGDVIEVIGASGGSRITTMTAFTTMHNLWFKERIDAALDTPRLHHQLVPIEISLEPNVAQDLINGLKDKGHNISAATTLAAVQGIHNTCTECGGSCIGIPCIHAASDGRKGGVPDGY